MSVETEISANGPGYAPFRRSWVVTDMIMAMVRRRAGTTPILAFSCDSEEPYTAGFEAIAARHGVTFLRDVATSVEAAERRGVHVRAGDGLHWNETGHAIAGEVISKHIASVISTIRGR